MKVIGVIYRDETSDIKQYENFLAEVSKFEIIGQPVFSNDNFLMYRALIKVNNSFENSKIDNLVDKYKVRVC